jgi:hypothetical protein
MKKLLSLCLGLGLVLATVPARADHPDAVTRSDVQSLRDDLRNLEDSLNAVPTSHARYNEFRDRSERVRQDVTRLRDEMQRHQRDNREGYGASKEDVRLLSEDIRRLQSDVDTALDRRYTSGVGDLDTGTTLQVRLETPVSSATARQEDRVRARVARSVYDDGRNVIPTGAIVEGVVTKVDRAQRGARGGQIEISFDRLRLTDGTTMPIDARVIEVREDIGNTETAGRAGIGAALGGILGQVIGGTKGAILGVLVGGAGGAISSKGDDVELPEGTVLTLELERPINFRR